MKPLIYIASPYSHGNPELNTRFQCIVWHRLWESQLVVPFAPLWSHQQELIAPVDYDDYVEWDNELIKRRIFQGCLRLNAYLPQDNYLETRSPGADNEVKLFESLNLPVFHGIIPLLDAARNDYFSKFASIPSGKYPI